MKKLVSVLLALLLLLSVFALAACDKEDEKDAKETKPVTQKKDNNDDDDEDDGAGTQKPTKTADQKTARELYNEAFTLLSNMTQYDVTSSVTIVLSTGIETETQTVQTTMAAKKGTDSAYTRLYTPATMYTEESVSEVWYADGVGYAYDGESKEKFEGVAFDTYADIMIVSFDEESDWVAAEDIVWGQATHEKTDTGFLSTLPLSADCATELAEEYSQTPEMAEGSFVLAYDKNGTITETGLMFDFSATDIGVQYSVEMETKYNSINKPVTVTAPADADEYVTGTFEGGSGNGGNSGVSDDEWGADWMYALDCPAGMYGDLDNDGYRTHFDWYLWDECGMCPPNHDGDADLDYDDILLDIQSGEPGSYTQRVWELSVESGWQAYAATYGPNA